MGGTETRFDAKPFDVGPLSRNKFRFAHRLVPHQAKAYGGLAERLLEEGHAP